ncbi:MAG: M28 family peptidase [Anaerolineae bacterium]|nr:M28 family peptidase [Anaerolineae bacterium]
MTDPRLTETIMAHVRALSAVGARPAADEGERLAASYVQEQLDSLGLADIREQSFVAPSTSGWKTMPPALLLAVGSMLAGGDRSSKLIGGLTTLFGLWAQRAAHLANPIIPVFSEMGISQNLIAKIRSSGETRHTLYLIAHLDTDRQRLSALQPLSPVFRLLNTAAILLNILSAVSMLWDALLGIRGTNRMQRLTQAVNMGQLALHLLEEQSQPHVEGANDNASGVGALLALADSLKADPLEHTEVVLLFTGAQETFNDGLQVYLDRFAPSRDLSTFIDIDSVGAGDVTYVTRQGLSVFADTRPSPHITALAAATARQHADLQVSGREQTTINAVINLVRQGYQAIGITAVGSDGTPPHRHQISDVLANIEPDTPTRAVKYILALAREIDASFAQ